MLADSRRGIPMLLCRLLSGPRRAVLVLWCSVVAATPLSSSTSPVPCVGEAPLPAHASRLGLEFSGELATSTPRPCMCRSKADGWMASRTCGSHGVVSRLLRKLALVMLLGRT